MRLKKHSLLSIDRNSFRTCVRFLNQSDRWAMRRVCKTVDDSLRQEYSFAQMIICNQEASWSFAQIKRLRSKFQFHALKLLVIRLWLVVRGITPSDDLFALLVDLPGLRLSLRASGKKPTVSKIGGRGAVLSIVEAADILSLKEGWADNDRWRISMFCRGGSPHRWYHLSPGFDFGHPRITAYEWDMRWGPLLSAQEWVGELAVARNSEMPPTGSYPILTSVHFLGEEGPVDWLVDWLAQTDSPLLSDLIKEDTDPGMLHSMKFRGSVEQCWLTRPLTVHVDTSCDALIAFLKNRSWEIDLRSLWLDGVGDGHEWGSGRLNCESLEDLKYHGEGVWIKKYAQFSLPNLRRIELSNVNVKAWREYLVNVEIPLLKFAILGDYLRFANCDESLELLQLPVFSHIKELKIVTTARSLFGRWDPISLPELKVLTCVLLSSPRGEDFQGNFRFLAPLRTLTFRNDMNPHLIPANFEPDNRVNVQHRLEHQFPCAKVVLREADSCDSDSC